MTPGPFLMLLIAPVTYPRSLPCVGIPLSDVGPNNGTLANEVIDIEELRGIARFISRWHARALDVPSDLVSSEARQRRVVTAEDFHLILQYQHHICVIRHQLCKLSIDMIACMNPISPDSYPISCNPVGPIDSSGTSVVCPFVQINDKCLQLLHAFNFSEACCIEVKDVDGNVLQELPTVVCTDYAVRYAGTPHETLQLVVDQQRYGPEDRCRFGRDDLAHAEDLGRRIALGEDIGGPPLALQELGEEDVVDHQTDLGRNAEQGSHLEK